MHQYRRRSESNRHMRQREKEGRTDGQLKINPNDPSSVRCSCVLSRCAERKLVSHETHSEQHTCFTNTEMRSQGYCPPVRPPIWHCLCSLWCLTPLSHCACVHSAHSFSTLPILPHWILTFLPHSSFLLLLSSLLLPSFSSFFSPHLPCSPSAALSQHLARIFAWPMEKTASSGWPASPSLPSPWP